jgi:uncharacterized protein YcgI (DUF1989 family)
MPPQAADQDIIVAAGHGHALTLEAGAFLTVMQTTGRQVADTVAFRSDDLTEYLSTSHTIASNGRLWPGIGQRYLSNRRTPLLEVVADTVGRHDLIIAACDPWRYRYDFGVENHRSCSDNFLEVFKPHHVERHRLPHPVNLFQNMLYHEDGRVEFRTSIAEAGDYVVLQALVPLLVGVSACPMDLNPISGGRPSDIRLRVSRSYP